MSKNIVNLEDVRRRRQGLQKTDKDDDHELEVFNGFGPAGMAVEQRYIQHVGIELSQHIENLFEFEATRSVDRRKTMHRDMTGAITYTYEDAQAYMSERFKENGRAPHQSLSHAIGISALLLCRLDRNESAMRITKRAVGKRKPFYEEDLQGKLIVIHAKKRQFDDTKRIGETGDVLCYRSVADKTLIVLGAAIGLSQAKSEQGSTVVAHETDDPREELVTIKYDNHKDSIEVSLPEQRAMPPMQDVIKAQVWSI